MQDRKGDGARDAESNACSLAKGGGESTDSRIFSGKARGRAGPD